MNLKVIVMLVMASVLVDEILAITCPPWGKKNSDPSKEDEKSKKKPPKKGGKNPSPLPPIVYNGLSTVEISSMTQMINAMKFGDWCIVQGKTGIADSKCKQLVGFLDRLQDFRRTKECPRVTSGECRKTRKDADGKDVYECTCYVYERKKSGYMGCFPRRVVDSSKLLLFKDCVAPGYA